MDIDHKITIRYDGMDSAAGTIELFALGESLKGVARIAATAGHFALTEKYSSHFVNHEVKVLALPPRDNCFSIDISWEFIKQHQILAGSFSAIITVLIPLIFYKASGRLKEMKLIKDSLDKAIHELGHRDEKYILRLIDVIETMSSDLKSSVRSAVAPIGETCDTLTIKSAAREDTYTPGDKAVICKDKDNELTESRAFDILISELDRVTGSCKVTLPEFDGTRRIAGKITDPLLDSKNNPYSVAFAADEWISVIAKGQLKEGELSKLFISDLNI